MSTHFPEIDINVATDLFTQPLEAKLSHLEVLHFYDTRDALPAHKPGDPSENLTCWPLRNILNLSTGNSSTTSVEPQGGGHSRDFLEDSMDGCTPPWR